MLLLPFKILFLAALFGVWVKTGKVMLTAGVWAIVTFLLNICVSGMSFSAIIWGIASFFVAYGIFLGLSYLQRSFLMIPGGLLGVILLVVLS